MRLILGVRCKKWSPQCVRFNLIKEALATLYTAAVTARITSSVVRYSPAKSYRPSGDGRYWRGQRGTKKRVASAIKSIYYGKLHADLCLCKGLVAKLATTEKIQEPKV